jgi:alginate O-acetyltransferase complex protein AlgJ
MSIPIREQQALREVGRTEIRASIAATLVLLFLLSVVVVPLLQAIVELRETTAEGEPVQAEARVFPDLVGLVRTLPRVARTAAEQGLWSANRELLAALDAAEDGLEESSFLRRRLLPPVQQLMTGWLGAGNEQAYPGREGWLFYRADVDYVTGPGFLEPQVLLRRSRGGDEWTDPPQPDPLPALEELHRYLTGRGVDLVIMPTPVKPTIHPEFLSPRAAGAAVPIHNPSLESFRRRLAEVGITLFDVSGLLAGEKRLPGDPLYLRTDTHWTPQALDRAAQELAVFLEDRVELSERAVPGYVERSVTVQNRGDIATMLRLSAAEKLFPAERVVSPRVLSPLGRAWRSDPGAEILLLGDSFSNIYSEPGLGWGAGAGLAERLSFHLQRPVDRIALNAGGAYASRQVLARELASGKARLAGKRVVVYQFAARELAGGDWRRLDYGD